MKMFIFLICFGVSALSMAQPLAICHTQLDEKTDVFFQIQTYPDRVHPETASIRVDVYRDFLFSADESVAYSNVNVHFTKLPETSTLISVDKTLKIEWLRENESDTFSKVKNLMWISPLTQNFQGRLQVLCRDLE